MKTPDCVLDGEVCALDEAGPRELLRDAAAKPDSARLLRLRPPRGRGRAARRPTDRGAAGRLEELLDKRDRTVRLSEFFDDGDALLKAAKEQRARRHRRQAGGLAIRGREAHARLAEGQDPRRPGARHRRLHEGPGTPLEQLRLARPRLLARGASWSTPETSAPASTTSEIQKLLGKLRPLERDEPPFRERAEDAQGPKGRRGLGGAEAGGPGRVRRVDARRAPARAGVQGAAGGQNAEEV